MRHWCLLVVVVALLVACNPATILPPTPTPVAVNGTVVPETKPPIAKTPVAATGSWQFREPRTADNNALIETEEGLALDPAWQIARVEYAYQWWGLSSTPALEPQVIEREGDTFTRDGTSLTAADMEAFVASLTHFYPTQYYVYGNAWTDDYPTHTIEITGEDGQRFLLISTSTGNVGDGPWNLVYNDRLYAQYDGSFANGMAAVFDYTLRGTIEGVFEGTVHEGLPPVHFATEGLPRPLLYGFDGLLPISESFYYTANLQDGVIEGEIVGRSSVGGFGNMVIGTFTTLDTVVIENAAVAPCEITPLDIYDAVGAAWTFRCAVSDVAEDDAYLYPITVTLGNERGENSTLAGTLSGVWSANERPLRLPFPPFLQAILAENEDAAALLAQHEYVEAAYKAALDPIPPHVPYYMMGDVNFYGTTTHDAQPLRYEITTAFAVSATDTLYWTLTPDKVSLLLSDTLALPQTQALLANDPDTTLHLGYFVNYPIRDTFHHTMPAVTAGQCGTPPVADPDSPIPVRAVGYRLAGGEIYGGLNEAGQYGAAYAALDLSQMPVRLADSDTLLDEGYLYFEQIPRWSSLTIGFDPADATPERIATFEAWAETLGTTLNYPDQPAEEYPEWWTNASYTLNIDETGTVVLTACE
jgi:hypothetical protein